MGIPANVARLGTSEAHRIAILGLPPRSTPEYYRELGIEPPPPVPPFTNRAVKRAFAAKLKAWLRIEAKALDAYEARLGTRDMSYAYEAGR